MAKYRLCGGLAMMAEHDMGMLKDMSAKGWHVSGRQKVTILLRAKSSPI